jgi:hypothetical protein
MAEMAADGASGPMAKPPAFLSREWWLDWQERHQHPVNYALHLIGIPLTIVGPLSCPLFWWVGDSWLDLGWGMVVFLAGYALQFLGHAIEGNDAGEVIAVKRRLGLPYVAVAPRHTGGAIASGADLTS